MYPNWNNWNAIAHQPASALPSPRLSYLAHHHAQLIGCGEAEVAEGELLGVGRTVERRIERAVGAAGDVDEAPLVDAWVELLHGQHVCSMRSKESGVMHFLSAPRHLSFCNGLYFGLCAPCSRLCALRDGDAFSTF